MNRSPKRWKERTLIRITFISCIALLWLAGCSNNNHKSDQQLQQQAAQDTERARAEAQQAAAQARATAANAERKVNDIAAGVKEGLHANANGTTSIDINSAREDQLTALPGITSARARRIIHDRPYNSPHDLVSKGVLSQQEYYRISSQITAGQ